jgi:hypothetical protein
MTFSGPIYEKVLSSQTSDKTVTICSHCLDRNPHLSWFQLLLFVRNTNDYKPTQDHHSITFWPVTFITFQCTPPLKLYMSGVQGLGMAFRLVNCTVPKLMSVCPCIVDDTKTVKPTRCYTMVYWTLWFTQHVSGIIMPIIRSLRLYRWPQRVTPHLGYGRLLVWCMAVGLSVRVEGCCTEVVQHPSTL